VRSNAQNFHTMNTNALTRRKILHSAAMGFALGAIETSRSEETTSRISSSPAITDTNVFLDQWPIRHLPLAEPTALAVKLKSQCVTEAWAGSLDALFHKDLAEVNSRTTETCAQHSIFKPIGAVNLSLPRWEDDIEHCATKHRMRGIRLHPNYHSYKLDDPRFVELLKLATSHKLFVQIAFVMEDERTQHPLLRVAPIDISPLPKALESVPGARVMLCNWTRSSGGKPTLTLLKNTDVMFDVAQVEGILGIETLLEELPLDRIVFGSYAPVFYFEAAKLKLQESALDEKQLAAITHENAARFIEG
jgi:hypothetical protein